MANTIPVPTVAELEAICTAYNAWDSDQADEEAEHEGGWQCCSCEGRFQLDDRDFDATPTCHRCAHEIVQMFTRAVPELLRDHRFNGTCLSKVNDAIGRAGIHSALYYWDAIDQIAAERDALHARVTELERQLADAETKRETTTPGWQPPGGLARRPRFPRRRR